MKWSGKISIALATVATLFGAVGTPDAKAQEKKPNIVVIMGDDIGMWNIGAYHRGLMAGKTPNLDKLAKEGMLFTDYYAEASCTAGRANFITGELPIRTGMTTVGQAGAKIGIPADAVTIATILKSMGYATGQFGKNHPPISTSTYRAFTASTNSLVICITWMRWRIRRIPTIRRIS
jgi:arylsulfatase A-like enzyme